MHSEAFFTLHADVWWWTSLLTPSSASSNHQQHHEWWFLLFAGDFICSCWIYLNQQHHSRYKIWFWYSNYNSEKNLILAPVNVSFSKRKMYKSNPPCNHYFNQDRLLSTFYISYFQFLHSTLWSLSLLLFWGPLDLTMATCMGIRVKPSTGAHQWPHQWRH